MDAETKATQRSIMAEEMRWRATLAAPADNKETSDGR